ncbi:hypothetical protein D8674_026197 [Pyrus ussuriensis x Pyrus communis]|uniref:RNase H type-1 domain-containing protein n=1 Tax=Pyrus ussuriensis x Pyrus communis TaxID=2448454 RepID=A0A5N5I9A6_9ROSA|nr:hypothetical protein D8674_026197 [Pyrus ussuriensis x Pyrus communis]
MPLMVADLINANVGVGKTDVVRTYFDKEEGDIIFGWPVSLAGCQDRLIWHYSTSGAYTALTGYGVAMERQVNGELGRKGNAPGRPTFGVLKFNCDGAWCEKTSKGGYGWVLRDFVGLLHAAGGAGGLFFRSAAMAEAAAIRAAQHSNTKPALHDVEIESDSQWLIQMINGIYGIDATLECFIYDISQLVSQNGRVRFLFVKQNGIAAVHAVASYFLFNILAKNVNVSIHL